MSARRNHGFAMLEAIVAITIMAAALVPIFALLSTSLDAGRKLYEANLKTDVELATLDVIRSVNPMDQPTGIIDLELYKISWASTPLAPPIDQIRYPRGLGLYKIGMYQVDVKTTKPDGAELCAFSVRLIGYHLTRSPQMPFSAPN